MATIIKGRDAILEELIRENKVQIMNSPEHRAETRKRNERMRQVHRDYLIKSSRSELRAATTLIL